MRGYSMYADERYHELNESCCLSDIKAGYMQVMLARTDRLHNEL
jgi:hypothetical protein